MQNNSCGLGESKTLKKISVRHFYAKKMELKAKDFVNLRPLLIRSMKQIRGFLAVARAKRRNTSHI